MKIEQGRYVRGTRVNHGFVSHGESRQELIREKLRLEGAMAETKFKIKEGQRNFRLTGNRMDPREYQHLQEQTTYLVNRMKAVDVALSTTHKKPPLTEEQKRRYEEYPQVFLDVAREILPPELLDDIQIATKSRMRAREEKNGSALD